MQAHNEYLFPLVHRSPRRQGWDISPCDEITIKISVLNNITIMKKLTTLLLALIAATTAWATDGTLSGSGTQSDPYVIADAADWATFAANVNAGTNASAYYQLSNSFSNASSPVGATVGTESSPFTGTFDGNGRTLNVDINDDSENGTAPFRYISGGATIKNLTVSGTVTGGIHCAGLVGFSCNGSASSPNTIDNCTVEVTIEGGTHNGGVVGHGTTSFLTIRNTVFSGILSSGSNYSGGIQGWSDSNTLTLENCLFCGTYEGSNTFHPIAIHNPSSPVTVSTSNCFYTLPPQVSEPSFIAAAGNQAYTSAPSNVLYQSVTAADGNNYYAQVNIEGMKPAYLYTGSAIDLGYTLTNAEGTALVRGTDYTVALTLNGAAVGNIVDEGTYTITYTGIGNYSGSQTFTFDVNDGIAMTSTTTTLEDGCTYKVSSNVTISSRITVLGNVELKLLSGYTLTASKGIDVGADRTLTISGEGTLTINSCNSYNAGIGSTGNAAQYGHIIINGGTINVTGGSYAAGIGGGQSNYSGSGSSVTINGGIVNATGGNKGAGIGGGFRSWAGDAYGVPGDITINGGQVTATGGTYAPGIGKGYQCTGTEGSLTLGWTTASTDFVSVSSVTINTITFTSPFIIEGSGETATSSNIISGCKLIPNDENTLKNLSNATVGNMSETYHYTGSAISINFILKDPSGNTLTEGTHYTTSLTLNGETVESALAVGEYTLTFTAVSGGGYTGSKTLKVNVLLPV